MANRLADQTSPYLLQHQNNPVHWYPWGPEAIERARREAKPIFLSIGYSACHWCHVMEHESFENETIAAQLNEHFVAIKVDREERPDLDQIYMSAVQLLTGRGGWPMSVFLTPDLRPFHGGTYWPPEPRMGMPGFGQVLTAVADAWQNRRDEVFDGAGRLTDELRRIGEPGPPDEISLELLHGAAAALERAFDFQHGGFGQAPKFPHSLDLQVLLRYWRHRGRDGVLDMVRLTLDRMAAGGIYDHLGGGFARYSVDERWLVPHFEKMLYDNALLCVAYTEAFQATGEERYAQVVRETLDYVLRDMTGSAGGFFSSEDADSEGVEGKFYVWTPEELEAVLGTGPAKTFGYVYDVAPGGNFEGQSILNKPKTLEQCASILNCDAGELAAELADSRAKLFARRKLRIAPGKDDKVLVSWNGLMIDALARAGAVLVEPRYVEAARRAADFLWDNLRRDDGRLLHTWRNGRASLDAYLDDYAALAGALVSLYEAAFDERDVDRAIELADQMLALFGDGEQGGFFYTANDHEQLILRNKEFQDGSIPSGNSLATMALLRLGRLTGRVEYSDFAERTLCQAAPLIKQHPAAAGQMLVALDLHLDTPREIVLVGGTDSAEACRDAVGSLARRFLPNQVVALRGPIGSGFHSPALASLFAGRDAKGDEIKAFVCERFACEAPAAGLPAIRELWQKLGSA